jgi:hypothetical protein
MNEMALECSTHIDRGGDLAPTPDRPSLPAVAKSDEERA